jgi:hypothetical protein
VLEVIVPYSLPALERWLRGAVDQACSESTARAMAMAGFERARSLSVADALALRGIGSTASLVSNRPKRGPHRVHVAWQSATATVVESCDLAKNARTRGEEEIVAGRLVLYAVAETCGVTGASPPPPSADEPIHRREKQAPLEWTELLLGQRHSVQISSGPMESPRVVFPGAFRPLHIGHRRMAEIAAQRLGAPVTFELSITNVDKPMLDFVEIDDRLRQLADRPVLLTRAATFVEKAAIVPGAVFMVGVDTVARLSDPLYYGGSRERRDAAVAAIAERGCRFLVFGRVAQKRFRTLSGLELSDDLRALCDEVPQEDFREDVSSTDLRMYS